MDTDHRMLRTIDGNDALQGHFGLGVNFVGSLVNRHRIELHILDAHARVAASFKRLRWDERQVVERAIEVLRTTRAPAGKAPAGERFPLGVAGRPLRLSPPARPIPTPPTADPTHSPAAPTARRGKPRRAPPARGSSRR